ncbi:MAG TPA: ABC transporter permease, partial [Thermoclostridium caenicola]|nr:ABC transporter permease [Thermoclostridium caenicola]
MNTLFFLIQQTMFFTIPLLVVALGGMFSERSGVINIALEGIMIMGGFCSILFISFMQDTMAGQPLLLLAILIAMISGAVFSLLHAYASINMKADQTISGTALNLMAPAVSIFAARMIQPSGVQQIQFTNTFRIAKVPVLGDIPILGDMFFQNVYLTTYIGVAILIIAAILLYKTKFGLRLRACGEHPQAADSVGVNVYRMRYAGVFISGML